MSHHSEHRPFIAGNVNWLPNPNKYQEVIQEGPTFLVFTKDSWSGDDPTPDFLEAAKSLQRNTGGSWTLPDGYDLGYVPNLFHLRVVMGYYLGTTTHASEYGFVEINMGNSTTSSSGYGVTIRFNDGRIIQENNWVRVKWISTVFVEGIYVHFAAGNDGTGNALLAMRFGPGDGDADSYEVAYSHE